MYLIDSYEGEREREKKRYEQIFTKMNDLSIFSSRLEKHDIPSCKCLTLAT